MELNLLDPAEKKLRLESLLDLTARKPEPFEPGEPLFWDDPYISRQMLAAHLDPDTDAASRRPEAIDGIIAYLVERMHLQPGDEVLDLGCGPGLYCERLARLGMRVTGVDYSRNSIAHARQSAEEKGLPVEYICRDYLGIDYEDRFACVLLIYGDFCVPADDDRDRLLGKIHRALKPGGYFAFDVTTPLHHAGQEQQRDWHLSAGGFWRPGLHLVLEQHFSYPGRDIFLDQYTVIEESGRVALYRNWFHDYEAEPLASLLRAHGFAVCETMGDLAGTPYRPGSEWIGMVARKPALPST